MQCCTVFRDYKLRCIACSDEDKIASGFFIIVWIVRNILLGFKICNRISIKYTCLQCHILSEIWIWKKQQILLPKTNGLFEKTCQVCFSKTISYLIWFHVSSPKFRRISSSKAWLTNPYWKKGKQLTLLVLPILQKTKKLSAT